MQPKADPSSIKKRTVKKGSALCASPRSSSSRGIGETATGSPASCELEGRMSYDRQVGVCSIAGIGDVGEAMISAGACQPGAGRCPPARRGARSGASRSEVALQPLGAAQGAVSQGLPLLRLSELFDCRSEDALGGIDRLKRTVGTIQPAISREARIAGVAAQTPTMPDQLFVFILIGSRAAYGCG